MASWAPSNPKFNYKAVIGNEMGFRVSHKSIGLDLVQNCDLPPPLKVVTGSDKTIPSSMNRIRSMMGKEDHHEFNIYRCEENDNLQLLKALRLSQTRAREAEKKAATLELEINSLSNALLEEARKLFGYRQWVKFLELQISKLNSKWVQQEKHACFGCQKSKGVKLIMEEEGGGDDEGGDSWMFALALCLGTAGVGFVFSCRLLLF